MTRLYGWAPKGERLIDKVPHSHWETATFLAALRSDRIDAPCLFDGPINGERFRAYVEQFLVPTLKAGDVVILDNLGSHKGKAGRKAIRDVGLRLVFLPKYSPDLNPIEQLFAKFKTLLRKVGARTYEAISAACGEKPQTLSRKRMRRLHQKRRLCVKPKQIDLENTIRKLRPPPMTGQMAELNHTGLRDGGVYGAWLAERASQTRSLCYCMLGRRLRAAVGETRKLAAILVSDVVGYSRLAGADEDRILARLRALRSDLIDPTIAVHHGRIVKRTGDGTIIEFRSVVDAVRCAIEVQSAMVERNAGVPPDKRIEFRIGIHLGDVVEESDGDLMGDGVNIAARLEGIAKPGAICLSEDAYRQVKRRLDLTVTDLGAMALKNIAEPMRAYSVEVGKPATAPKPKPAPRSRLVPAAAALAALLVAVGAAAAAWYLTAGKPAAVVAPPTPVARSGPPTVAILPFANTTGNAQYDALAQRIGQKTTDAASNATIWRVVAAREAQPGAPPTRSRPGGNQTPTMSSPETWKRAAMRCG